MVTPTFPKRDPASPEFWDLRYGAHFAPWDAGRVPVQLRAFVESWAGERRALVPGCGSAWDVRFLADGRWDVLGIDFSPEAIEAARPILGPRTDRIRLQDFFAPIAGSPFPVVYERAFLCALPRRLWPAWARRVSELIPAQGVLAGFFFFGDDEKGPPFPIQAPGGLDELLSPYFSRKADEAVPDSIPVFAGRERWQVWERR